MKRRLLYIIVVIIIIIIAKDLQPFVGPWPLFQFIDPIHSRCSGSGMGSTQAREDN
jgi:hypothetical protein